MGQGTGQFGRKPEIFRDLLAHPLDGVGPGHLIPGVIQFRDGKDPGIARQQITRRGAGRVKARIDPFRIGIPAGADHQAARWLFVCGGCVHGQR